ncbi:MAG: KamA family radical SAM protein [Acidobacteria bacterium]|nr:KamA family radical SAM protein [Acidobacteriota bacterium]|tara:strand:+ start:1377 stop:2528 length:1152 start_codon:yes stop_codon:yes gene_type:complete
MNIDNSATQNPLQDSGPKRVKYVRKLEQVTQLTAEQRDRLGPVSARYVFRANDYYLGLINWEDPDDPIRQLIIPREEELTDWGALDASNEESVTVARGVQHKYTDTVLLLCNEVCGAYCRYCFRKRLFMDDNDETTNDITEGLAYIASHPEVTNVLLTGGDPLLMSTRRLTEIFDALRSIDHVQIIRIGSKMPAFDPYRVLNDQELQSVFRTYSTPKQRIYLMAHFDHPNELTPLAIEGIDSCIRNGVICVNQCPIIRGINDDPTVLAEMYSTLSYIGCSPYYLFQGRPTAGNQPYEVPIVEGWTIFQNALKRGSGLARRARFCMSHETGKIEIIGVDTEHIYLRYHQAKYAADLSRFFICRRDDNAYWLDQLEVVDRQQIHA